MAKKQTKFLGISKNIWIWAGAGFLGYMILKPRSSSNTTQSGANTTTSGGTVTPPPTSTTTSDSGLSITPTVDGIYIGAIDEKKVDLVIYQIFKDKYIYKKLVNLYLPKIKNMIDNGTYTDKAGYVIVEKFLKWFYTEYYRQYRRGGDYELSKEDKKYVITYLLDFLLDEFTNYGD